MNIKKERMMINDWENYYSDRVADLEAMQTFVYAFPGAMMVICPAICTFGFYHTSTFNIGFSLPTEPRDTPSLLSVTVPSLQCSVKGPSLLFEPRERVYLRYNYVLTAPIRALLLELCLGTPDPNSCTYAGVPDQEFHDYFNNREDGLVNPLSRSRAEMIALLQGGTPIAPVVTAAAVAPRVPPSQEQIGAVDPTGALNQVDA
jgi:hypothetical protein